MSAAELPGDSIRVPSEAPPGVIRVRLRMWRTRLGAVIVAVLCAIALFGRYVAPYGEQEAVGLPFKVRRRDPQGQRVRLGQRRARRVVAVPVRRQADPDRRRAGHRCWPWSSEPSIGLIAAYNRRRLDDVLMRAMDVLLALPQIITALVVISMFGATTMVDRAHGRPARPCRASPASCAVPPSRWSSATSWQPPNRWVSRGSGSFARSSCQTSSGPLLVEANLRLTFAIGLIAGIAFLGFTPDPGAANWGLMINENRKGLIGDQPLGCHPAGHRHRPVDDRHGPGRRRVCHVRQPASTEQREKRDRCGADDQQPAHRSGGERLRHRRRRQPDDRPRPRCSVSSANLAPARPPSAWPCSVTPAAA